ncbi:MAG: helicase, partial [Theionarchaea archaeon]|nr:helicase [Theionarchaea archaeon]
MREIFLTELAAEVLGPREGINEIISSSPLNEYITGVLAPIAGKAAPDIDSEAEIPLEDTQVYGEEAEEDAVPFFSPALDPKKRPPSMGISFMVKSVTKPRVKVCLTWSRYMMENKEGNAIWMREPRFSIQDLDINQTQTILLGSDGKNTTQDQAEISLHVITHPEDSSHWFVSLYLVNRIPVPQENIKNDRITAEYYIFQPQIRLSCSEGTQVIPGRKIFQAGKDKELEFLYRDRSVLARGHMCSAMWKEIDPERIPVSVEVDFPECLRKIPFSWCDGELLDENERELFCPADLRTEFVPVYAVLGADFRWPAEYGAAPDFRADVLAETWDPDKLKSNLSLLADGYERWIERMEELIDSTPEQYKEIAQNMIKKCYLILKRIKNGINILYVDENARIAFCFANKAIDLQHRWMYDEGLGWYPFQLAFILMAVEPTVNPSSEHRKTCDLLWIPTGGGKTEAYLAITAFTIGYRRRRSQIKGIHDRTGVGISVLTRYTLRLLTIQQFRRTLALVTACEYLRVHNIQNGNQVGWRPESCRISDNFLWGSAQFTAGMWVGGK